MQNTEIDAADALPLRVENYRKAYDKTVDVIVSGLGGVHFEAQQNPPLVDPEDRPRSKPVVVDGGKMLKQYYDEIKFPPAPWTAKNKAMVERLPSLERVNFMDEWIPRFSARLEGMAEPTISKRLKNESLSDSEEHALAAYAAITSPSMQNFRTEYRQLRTALDQHMEDQEKAARQKVLAGALNEALQRKEAEPDPHQAKANNEQRTREDILAATRKNMGL